MEWLSKLVSKLPSWKSITEFFYVAAHWSEISKEREEFRKQIRDREEWLKQHAEHHEVEKERLQHEVLDWVDRAKAGLELAKQSATELEKAKDLINRVGKDLLDSTWLLAVMLSTEGPLTRGALLPTLSPTAQALINAHIEKLRPPPPSISLGKILGPLPESPYAQVKPPPLLPSSQQNFESAQEDPKQ